MASGNLLAELRCPQGFPPPNNSPLVSRRVGASTPPEAMLTWAFIDGEDNYVDFYFTLPNKYDGGGLTVIVEIEDIASTNKFRIALAWRRLELTDDFDSTAHTYDYNQITVTGTGTQGKGLTGTITFTDGVDQDGVTGGDHVLLRLWRNYIHADDNATETCYIRKIIVKET